SQEQRGKRAEQHSSSVFLSGGHLGRLRCLSALEPALMDWAFLSSDVFAGMKIDPKTLVKKLDLDSRSVVSAQTGVEEKTLLPKREKMKLRKDRWLQKIEGVKLARQKQKAEAKRKATPVVGDMQPLMEALPELSELTTTSKQRGISAQFPRDTGGGSVTEVPDELGLAFPAERAPLVADCRAGQRQTRGFLWQQPASLGAVVRVPVLLTI
uniref:SLX9 ribosome biosis factor n=1 Tax=Chelonoidis abingdonii TaxID=106734 RepID=A0A8C0J1S9_CHEAB